MNDTIDSFDDEYYFLSNFYTSDVHYKGITYPHNEAAFQAQKTHDKTVRRIFTKLSPQEAKRLGKNIRLRGDWQKVKVDIMYEICKAKFLQNPELKNKLIETGDRTLIEGNTWHDKYWGQHKGEGKNMLGNILMKIREELKED